MKLTSRVAIAALVFSVPTIAFAGEPLLPETDSFVAENGAPRAAIASPIDESALGQITGMGVDFTITVPTTLIRADTALAFHGTKAPVDIVPEPGGTSRIIVQVTNGE